MILQAPLPFGIPAYTFIPEDWMRTGRLRLRQWVKEDLAPFAAINCDPQVMRHLPALLSREQSDAHAARIHALIEQRGWGFWAVDSLQEKDEPRFIGFVGLHIPQAELPFSPCVEVGWRLDRAFWGKGLATEAARLAVRIGFEALNLPEIVAFTARGNQRSSAVMERLGMRNDPADDFDHPAVAEGNALRPHRLYRLTRGEWRSRAADSARNGLPQGR